MCDPITLAVLAASTAASIGGGMISSSESAQNANRMAAARNRVLEETRKRNLKHSDQNRIQFNDNLANTNDEDGEKLRKAQNDRTDVIQGNINPVAADVPLDANAPKVVQSNLAKTLADTFATSKTNAMHLGALGGYGDRSRDLAIGDSGTQSAIGTNNNFVAGNMGIMPYLQDYAQIRANKPSSGLGDMLSALGKMGSMYAGSMGGSASPSQ